MEDKKLIKVGAYVGKKLLGTFYAYLDTSKYRIYKGKIKVLDKPNRKK